MAENDTARCVTVVGAGTFGTAIAWMLCQTGNAVRMWCFEESDAYYINATGRNPLFLPHLHLDGVVASSDMGEAVCGCEAVVVVTPSFAVRSAVTALAAVLPESTPVAILSKGLDAATGKTLYETAVDVLGHEDRLCVMVGPNHAEEIAEGSYAGAVVASTSPETARYFQRLLMRDTFRLYTSDDPVGASICAAAKNVIAIACGMAHGMGQGDNTISLLMTRGLAELSRLVMACGGKMETCLGLAGIGDLNTTCNSPHSRNRSYGEAFAREGISVEDYEARRGMVVEGAHAIDALLALGERKGVDLPIMKAVKSLIAGEVPLEDIPATLMGRAPKAE